MYYSKFSCNSGRQISAGFWKQVFDDQDSDMIRKKKAKKTKKTKNKKSLQKAWQSLKKYWLWKVVSNKSFQIDIIYLFQIDTISSLSSAACTLAWFFIYIYIFKNQGFTWLSEFLGAKISKFRRQRFRFQGLVIA